MLSLTKEQLSEDYEWHYRVYEEGDSTAQEIRAFEALSPRREGIYLNYGSGAWSRSTEQLRERGWNVFAYEPHTAAQSASHGHLIANSAQLSEYRFDGIYSNNVLEHLRHPVQDLRLLRGLLNPGGLMAHATPCFDYLYPFTRFHLFFFVGRSAEELAARAGLRTVRWERDGEFICHVTEAAES
jgi:SAM-dependent methyltransferase